MLDNDSDFAKLEGFENDLFITMDYKEFLDIKYTYIPVSTLTWKVQLDLDLVLYEWLWVWYLSAMLKIYFLKMAINGYKETI